MRTLGWSWETGHDWVASGAVPAAGWRLFAATGDTRAVISDPHARYFGAKLGDRELTPGDGARIAPTGFDTWFARSGLERRG